MSKPAFSHNPFEYALQSESESETVDEVRAYQDQSTYDDEGVATTIFQPDGYGVTGEPMLHPLTLQGASDFRYNPQSPSLGVQDVP